MKVLEKALRKLLKCINKIRKLKIIIMILSKSNKLFKISLKKIINLKKNNYEVDVKDTIDLIQKNFIEVDECIIFDNKLKFKKHIWKEYNNRSEFESFENHIHMSDYILNENGLILLDFGLAITNLLSLKLKSVFPKYKFRIIISFDIVNEYGYNDCVIRFHRIRNGEESLSKNLEDYKKEAIGFLDF